ncbi:MAG TPA: glutamate--cysteine ligase [Ornithinimicrobium sp.]|nr:glutamate--cysteine ligase [Ornithinimicrobium sp.]
MRTVGVEEEFLLVDVRTGELLPVAGELLRETDDQITGEFLEQMIETRSRPHQGAAGLVADLRDLRGEVAARAARHGAAPAALSTSPLPTHGVVRPVERYGRIVDAYGALARQHLTCACHVHVEVADDEEGAVVLDGLREWLPTLLALSAGSPFAAGEETGYASYRWQLMARWPSGGPPPVVRSAEGYRSLVDGLLETGVILDRGGLYLDARLSDHQSTVEVRVADVCPDLGVTVLLAVLVRALVETAAERGVVGADRPVPGDRPLADTTMLRAATWQASRAGLTGDLVHPDTGRLAPAEQVLTDLVEHVRPGLAAAGDLALVEEEVRRVLRRGGEASRQREVLRRTGRLADVVADVARLTVEGT